jgi:hypothetical protein
MPARDFYVPLDIPLRGIPHTNAINFYRPRRMGDFFAKIEKRDEEKRDVPEDDLGPVPESNSGVSPNILVPPKCFA